MRLFFSIFFFCLFLFSCQMKKDKKAQDNLGTPFFLGTYTTEESEGIYKYILKKDGTMKEQGVVAHIENPSYLAMTADKKFLVAVSKVDKNSMGIIHSFAIEGDSLKPLSICSSGGANPCFAEINSLGFVVVANYSGGSVGLSQINEKGVLAGLLDVQQHFGKGTTERQEAPHAHSARFFPENNTALVIADLGINSILFSAIDTVSKTLALNESMKKEMLAGAGPRHIAFHPHTKRIYIVNELNSTITVLEKPLKSNTYTNIFSISTLPEGFKESNFSADIHVSSDGKFLYASNRGHNSIVIYKIVQKNGTLELLGHESTKGKWPRNFSLSPDENYLLVANQHTNNIVSFKRGKTTGLLEYVSEIKAPAPTCILF